MKVEFVILALPTISAAFVKVLNRIGERVAYEGQEKDASYYIERVETNGARHDAATHRSNGELQALRK